MKKIPIYHGSHPVLGCLPDLQKNTLRLLMDAHQDCGDAVRMRFLYLYGYSFIHPDQLKHLFQDNSANYNKETHGFKILRPVIGQAILASKGDLWRRQRRSALEEMKQERVLKMTESITETLEDVLNDWEQFSDLPINLHMSLYAFFCFDRACFGLGMDRRKVKEMIEKQDFLSVYFSRRTRAVLYFPSWVPTQENKLFLSIKKEIFRFSQGVIEEHRLTYKTERTLLGRIMRDNELEDGSLNEKMIRDELYAFVVLGNKTVGLGMQWLWYTIGQCPEYLNQLLDEIDGVVGKSCPTTEHLDRMPFLDAVIKEILRLYPPVFQIARQSIQEDCVGGYRLHKNHPVITCLYLVHRHKDFWERPNEFYPERFIKRDVKDRHTFSYMPFGRGPNQCTGYYLGTAEMKCMTIMILQRYIPISVNPSHTELKPLFELFSEDPIHIKWKRRK